MDKERKLILDTETTGLSFESDKIIEIGIVELKDKLSKTVTTELGFDDDPDTIMSKDVLGALIGLGYNEYIARGVIKKIKLTAEDSSIKSIESLIKEALKILND